ncbi:hypothetical protein ACFY5C_32205 [Streptomyces sp. NPDC012935]|uniref:hypothetical protein n=1 Tax=Streptomyces sp. NPDC012935 TaxID=3364857 RepID=UPI0036C14C8C
MPGRRTWFTVLGPGTLAGFLLHGFVAQAAKYFGWYDHAWIRQPVGELTVTLLAVAVMSVLCAPALQRVFRGATESLAQLAPVGRPARQPS